MLSFLTKQHFVPFLGQMFNVALENGVLPLNLQEVADETRHGAQGYKREPFSLFFCAPATVPLNQGTYMLTHPIMGELHIFLVPVGRQGEGGNEQISYQALFN